MIKFINGNMFETPADVRINTVNCVGVMGTGVALAFKKQYPDMFKEYKKECKQGNIRPGKPHVWTDYRLEGNTIIINFPTKDHWRPPSKYEYIEAGLDWLKTFLQNKGKVTVTLPALGCGHGGLDWDKVKESITNHLEDLNAEVFVFEPADTHRLNEEDHEDISSNAISREVLADIEAENLKSPEPIMKGTKIDALLDLLEIIHKTCIDKAPTKFTWDEKNMQVPFIFSMYSIVVELTGDSYQAVKSRKELASHVLTRALLEAVVILQNYIIDPDQVNNRFQKSLAKGKKPLKYQLDNPDLIDTEKHPIKDIKKLLDKHIELRDPEIEQSFILDDFKSADMEYYYYTSYAFLCNYSHHDVSAILKRNIGIKVNPLDERSTQKITNLITHLILKASISFHEFLKTDQVDVFEDLQQRWQDEPAFGG